MESRKIDRIDRQTDRGEADKYRLCVDREISHLDRSIDGSRDRLIDRAIERERERER